MSQKLSFSKSPQFEEEEEDDERPRSTKHSEKRYYCMHEIFKMRILKKSNND